MEKMISDLDFVLLIGALFAILTIVNVLAVLRRKVANGKLPSSRKATYPAPSFINSGIRWVKVEESTPEEVVE